MCVVHSEFEVKLRGIVHGFWSPSLNEVLAPIQSATRSHLLLFAINLLVVDLETSKVLNVAFVVMRKLLRTIVDSIWMLRPERILRKDRKSTRLNSSHSQQSRMPSSA